MRVPVIELAGVSQGKLAERIGGAAEEIGFATFVRHGVDKRLLRCLYAVSRELFAYPDSVLSAYETPETGRQTGFTSFGVETAKGRKTADLKRFWHVRRDGAVNPANIWPAEVPQFKPVCLELYAELDKLSFRLAPVLELYLGLPPGTLSNMIRGGDSLLRILHYRALTGRMPRRAVRSGEHTDIDFWSFLVAATAAGLVVLTKDGRWIAVEEEPDSIVWNVGDMLQMLTRGRMRSTKHKVINVPDERFSAPFFAHPPRHIVLDTRTGYTAGEFLDQRLDEIKLNKPK